MHDKIYFASYRVDEKSSVKAKLDSNAVLSTSFNQKLSEFVAMTVCAEVNKIDYMY